MLWLPWMRQLDKRWLRFLLALTIGLLVFLGIDAAIEGLDLGASGAESLGGGALMWLGAALAYLVLVGRGRIAARRGGSGGERVALLVAIGIGLHNLGEGLVIGSAYADRLARAGRGARRGLRDPQHDGGDRDRRAGGGAAAARRGDSRCSA